MFANIREIHVGHTYRRICLHKHVDDDDDVPAESQHINAPLPQIPIARYDFVAHTHTNSNWNTHTHTHLGRAKLIMDCALALRCAAAAEKNYFSTHTHHQFGAVF